ncbi:NADH-quinone oxidoreductase subunit NuoG [Blochmannia endosymbiont of Camponotus sp.]|uniref:NADH-quinone oxidoreductase subunit NuoG n=1 Tax=Blochmannia endosymbiont of Camponotus sp. TaxID=700220 RepID=UPI0020252D6F|nr:NADH-quinone oxidoreductase subunit NuoG [Blochmannia endosymbiont of Camponotus sp.]URJ29911.1 NADH-quinone oxidoreductase subunit NuoG [Blochmannia endosymbiont of Camponotus sp.]
MMVSIYIEGKKYTVEDSKNILEICLSLGFDIPYFCWHPALGSIGACRQCAVKKYRDNNKINDMEGYLVMSCMTPASDGSVITIFDDEVEEFRKNILELLMINHPHDCPVCEEGGNCHLQDMTVMVGQTYRRYRFAKRTHYNQYLGPFISHEMNRCISCYRCVRYYNDYAGGDDLGVFGAHDNIYFGRATDGALRSEFSGNLVEVCPTGVFTDKTQLKYYTRKWDMLFAPSICQQCSIGCNIIVGERYGKLCRVENRYNGNINTYFLCDRGRFGCDYVNIDNRPKNPLHKKDDDWVMLDEEQAIQEAANTLKYNCNKIIGIGSSRASVESNFALLKLVGADNFYTGINSCEQERLLLIAEILCNSGIYVPSLREIESYDTILILGEDLTQTGARLALSVRQASKGKARKEAEVQGIFDWQSAAVINNSQNVRNPILITGIDKTKLDDIAVLTYYDSVQNQARFGFAIAHALDNTAPAVKDFDCKFNDKLDIAVQKLMEARKPLIISGSNAGSKELIASAVNIALALKNRGSDVGITFVVSEVNSMGLVMLSKKSLDTALIDICSSHTSSIGLIVLENDLYRHATAAQVNAALNKINYLIVLDHQYNLIQEKANLVLSVSSFAESDGTVINYEGRAQRFFSLYKPQVYERSTVILESWRWLYLIHDRYTNYVRKKSLNIDQIIDAIIYYFPKLIGIKQTSPDATFRIYGQKLARAPHRYSGRTAIHTNVDVHEPCILKDNDTMFSFSMEGSHNVRSVHKQVAFAWAPGWNSPQAWNKFQDKVGGHLYSGDPGVRVLHTNNSSTFSWFDMIPQSFKTIENIDRWLIVPYWHLFGSEETSQRAKCIQDCMPNPYVMINQSDALRLNIKKNMLLKFTCAEQILCLPTKFSINLPKGHLGLPLGFPDIPVFLSGMYAHDVQGVLS